MIIDGTRLHVSDNSGAKEVECIKTRGRFASIGDIITCSVKKAGKGKVAAVSGGGGCWAGGLRDTAGWQRPVKASRDHPRLAAACGRLPKDCVGAGSPQVPHCAVHPASSAVQPASTPPPERVQAYSISFVHLQGSVVKAVVVETKKQVQRKDGR